MPFSRAPAEAAVREDTRADQPQRQGDDDQQRGDEPRRAVAQVHCAQIVHGAVEIQPRYHDDDRRHGDRDARVARAPLIHGGEQARRQRAEKRGRCRREAGQTDELEPQGVRYRADHGGDGRELHGTVEHQREAEHTAEAHRQPQQDARPDGQPQRQKIHRLQPQQQRHEPGGQRRHDDDHDRVGQPLKSGAHVLLGHVDAARDEREARNDEQHRADIPRLMLWVDGPEQRCQPEQPGIDQTCCRNGQGDAAKQRQVPLRQPRAHILPDARTQKGQQHLDRPAAEQERESAAGERRGRSLLQRGIAAACLRDLVEPGVQVVRRHVHAVERKTLDKALELVELGGVDEAIAREALRLAANKLPVKCKFVKKEEEGGEQ